MGFRGHNDRWPALVFATAVAVAGAVVGRAEACVIGRPPPGESHPTWSSDGRRIAFQVTNARGVRSVFVGAATGGRATYFAAGYEPEWSPLGQIAFLRYFPLPPLGRRPVDCPPGVVGPCFGGTSCDGNRFQTDVFAKVVRGSAHRVTSTGDGLHDVEYGLAWAPDGKRLAFASGSSDRLNQRSAIFVASPEGHDRVQLTENSNTYDTGPSWSPDGRRIVFSRSITTERLPIVDLYVMNADGSEQRPLTRTSEYEFDPAWSPDGRRLAFVVLREDVFRIVVADVDGSNPREVARGWDPAWSPTGRRIAFTARNGRRTAISVANADGSSVARLRFTFIRPGRHS